jgi:hypothetical protein
MALTSSMRWPDYLLIGGIFTVCFIIGILFGYAWFPTSRSFEGFQTTPTPDPTISQVYHYKPEGGYTLTKADALTYCQSNGGTLATDAQLQEAGYNGADWCSTGWLADSTDAKYPIKTSLQQGCGNGSAGIKILNPPGGKAGANCYGPKPSEGTTGVFSFNQSTWSFIPQYTTNPRYQEMYMRLQAQKFIPNQLGTLIAPKILEYGLAMSANNTINAVAYIQSELTRVGYSSLEASATTYVDKITDTMFGKSMDPTLTTYKTKSIIQKVYPRSWALFALSQTNNDPVAAREYIYNNYDSMDAKLRQQEDPVGFAAEQADPFNAYEVYLYRVGQSYTIPKNQAADICRTFGGTLATVAQLTQAQKDGADWCAAGWVADSNDAVYPITTSLQQGCGNGSAGIKTYTPPDGKAGVNCYGPKPPQGTPNIAQFNAASWFGYVSKLKERGCEQIGKARTELRSQLTLLRQRAQDLSGTTVTAQGVKKENMKRQYEVLSNCLSQPPSEDCQKLASLDPYLFETIPIYEGTLNQMFEAEINIQDKLDALNITSKFLGCSYTDLSGFDVDRELGIADVDAVKEVLKELSPYFIAPVVLNYITKLLVGEAEIQAATQPILTNVGAIAANIGNIRSITMR